MSDPSPGAPRGTAAPEPIVTTCPRPVDRAVMLQGWHDLASLHWPYEPAAVQALLPHDLRVDTSGGLAWVGLIPFHMHRIRPPRLPSLGAWSSFAETNVRTYVVGPYGRRAVWFLSLDVPRLAPAVVARTAYGLPYCWSRMSITHLGADTVEYTAARRWPHRGATSRLRIRIGERVAEPDELERFVTARWALAADLLGHGLWAEVDHDPWPLHRCELLACDDSLVQVAGLPEPAGDPLVLWSPGVEVRVGRPRRRSRGVGAAAPAGPATRRRSNAATMLLTSRGRTTDEREGTDDAA